MTWLVVTFKMVHVAALMVWCAGLVLLPLALSLHTAMPNQQRFNRVRLLTHVAYTQIVTPAAVIAVGAGLLLLFLLGVFEPWFGAKLLAVSLLVVCHAWAGHQVSQIAERRGCYEGASGVRAALGNVAVMIGILVLVLWKPEIPEEVMPDWLRSPYGARLWVDDPS